MAVNYKTMHVSEIELSTYKYMWGENILKKSKSIKNPKQLNTKFHKRQKYKKYMFKYIYDIHIHTKIMQMIMEKALLIRHYYGMIII